MRLYRFSPTEFSDDLTGTGGLYSAGRWNRKGTRLVYTSDCVSLAKLELLANSTTLPDGLSLVTINVPSDATICVIEVASLPVFWQRMPYLPSLTVLAENWLNAKEHWIMRVPSVHSPAEFNYLLNPLHPEHATLNIISIEPHPFDARLK